MPKTITLLKVFIASPSDVDEERRNAKQIIEELNVTFGNFHGIKMELMGWETHTYPSVGLDAQSVINSQIGEDYDIFLGIMWNRFGSPTSKAESGTEEEFDVAYKRFLENSEIELLFYFKDTAKKLSEINIEQLVKVNSFKEKLKQKGVYYKQFNQLSEFESLLRFGLTSILNKFSDSTEKRIVKQESKIENNDDVISLEAEEVLDDVEEVGFIESIEIGAEQMDKSMKSVQKMTKYITDLGENISIRTTKIQSATQKPQRLQSGIIRKIVDQLADDMTIFNVRVKAEIPISSEHFSQAIRYYNISMLAFPQLNEYNRSVLETATSLKEALIYASTGTSGMLEAVKATPNFTTKYAKAKKECAKILSELINEFNVELNLIEQLENSAKGLLSLTSD